MYIVYVYVYIVLPCNAEIYSEHHRAKAVRDQAEPVPFPQILDPELNKYFHTLSSV